MPDRAARGKPWRVDCDRDRLVVDASGAVIAWADTPVDAATIVALANSADHATAAEVARLSDMVSLLQDRDKMTVSDRQELLGESLAAARQPEADAHSAALGYIVDDLEDAAASRWWTQQAARLGLPDEQVRRLADELRESLRTHGRLLPV